MNRIFRFKNKFFHVSVGCVLFLMIGSTGFGQKVSSNTSGFNGIWKKGGDVIKIRQFDGRRLKVEYEGIYEYKYRGDPIANVGAAKGIAVIRGKVADFQDAKDANCKMTLKLSGGKLNLESTGCTFGQHVNAAGIYRKVSSRKPKFDW